MAMGVVGSIPARAMDSKRKGGAVEPLLRPSAKQQGKALRRLANESDAGTRVKSVIFSDLCGKNDALQAVRPTVDAIDRGRICMENPKKANASAKPQTLPIT